MLYDDVFLHNMNDTNTLTPNAILTVQRTVRIAKFLVLDLDSSYIGLQQKWRNEKHQLTFYLLSAVLILRQQRVIISQYVPVPIVRHLQLFFSGALIRKHTVV